MVLIDLFCICSHLKLLDSPPVTVRFGISFISFLHLMISDMLHENWIHDLELCNCEFNLCIFLEAYLLISLTIFPPVLQWQHTDTLCQKISVTLFLKIAKCQDWSLRKSTNYLLHDQHLLFPSKHIFASGLRSLLFILHLWHQSASC